MARVSAVECRRIVDDGKASTERTLGEIGPERWEEVECQGNPYDNISVYSRKPPNAIRGIIIGHRASQQNTRRRID